METRDPNTPSSLSQDAPGGKKVNHVESANRKLIRPSLTEYKELQQQQQQLQAQRQLELEQQQAAAAAAAAAAQFKPHRLEPRPDHRPDHRPSARPDGRPDSRPDSRPDHRPDSRPDRGGPPQKRPVPPDQTNAENFYYVKQMQSRTPMVVVLQDGEELHGVIEWYDRTCLKVNRLEGPNVLVYKANIKYLYKESDKNGASGADGEAG